METLTERASAVLDSAEPTTKVALTADAARAWKSVRIVEAGSTAPPLRPARPPHPRLVPPREVPRRRLGRGIRGRVALLHALAHVELNAVDLAWDLLARFTAEAASRSFIDDWLGVAEEEARHFTQLAQRLAELGAAYGDLPAHDGLWQAAEETSHDLLALLAVVPLVLEARGLDVTPDMCRRLRRSHDEKSAEILERIHVEEIGHVAVGWLWFDRICARRGLEAKSTYQALARRYYHAPLKPPFNSGARERAGLAADLYLPLAK